jgi:magnesium chelatase subunit D
MALALVLTTVSPEVGGVLVRGEKGTAKSTMVRALAEILPRQAVVPDCRFACDPRPDPTARTARTRRRIDQPTGPPGRAPGGATEDRVIGSLDLSKALGRGETAFEPGLLAQAHRGLLYVDEVNLLPRPSRRPAPRRRCHGPQHRRARRGLGATLPASS